MKKIIMAALFSLLMVSAAMAQYTGPMGGVTTVAEALKSADHTYVTLTGKIERYIGDEVYQFRDATGVINVEIDDELWYGFTAGSDDTVVIIGEVDKDFLSRTIEVKHISRQQ